MYGINDIVEEWLNTEQGRMILYGVIIVLSIYFVISNLVSRYKRNEVMFPSERGTISYNTTSKSIHLSSCVEDVTHERIKNIYDLFNVFWYCVLFLIFFFFITTVEPEALESFLILISYIKIYPSYITPIIIGSVSLIVMIFNFIFFRKFFDNRYENKDKKYNIWYYLLIIFNYFCVLSFFVHAFIALSYLNFTVMQKHFENLEFKWAIVVILGIPILTLILRKDIGFRLLYKIPTITIFWGMGSKESYEVTEYYEKEEGASEWKKTGESSDFSVLSLLGFFIGLVLVLFKICFMMVYFFCAVIASVLYLVAMGIIYILVSIVSLIRIFVVTKNCNARLAYMIRFNIE